jgi:hypothetical protein
MGVTISLMMKPSEEEKISGASELEMAIKKLSVAGKASINSKIGFAQAKANFAKQLYQVITDKRSSDYISSQIATTEAALLAQRANFLAWAIPGAVNIQARLLDNLASICSAFYYSEATECQAVSDASLQAFSLTKVDEFVQAVLKGVADLEDSNPTTRQKWTIIDRPLVIDLKSQDGQQMIESFRASGSAVIPAKLFQEAIPRLQYLSAVCMLSASVEVVGAKPSATGNQEVEVFVGSMGAPALQRSVNGHMTAFTTSTTSIKSSYDMEKRSRDVDMPYWGVEGILYNTEDRFCRTPFQDTILSVGKTSQGIDFSQVTAIKL